MENNTVCTCQKKARLVGKSALSKQTNNISRLPLDISYIILSLIFDDRDAVTVYLLCDPTMKKCLPRIVRDFFLTYKYNEGYGLPLLKSMPDLSTAASYFAVLWIDKSPLQRFSAAVTNNTAYLLPYLDAISWQEEAESPELNYWNDYCKISATSLLDAAEKGYTEIIKVLIVIAEIWNFGHIYDYNRACTVAIQNDRSDTLEYLLNYYSEDIYQYEFQAMLNIAAAACSIAIISMIISKFPAWYTDDVMIEAIQTARQNHNYDAAALLASYPR